MVTMTELRTYALHAKARKRNTRAERGRAIVCSLSRSLSWYIEWCWLVGTVLFLAIDWARRSSAEHLLTTKALHSYAYGLEISLSLSCSVNPW